MNQPPAEENPPGGPGPYPPPGGPGPYPPPGGPGPYPPPGGPGPYPPPGGPGPYPPPGGPGPYLPPGGPAYAYPGGGTVPPGAARGKVRPGRVWYLLAVAVLAGGVAWLVLSFTSFVHQVDSMPRAQLPQGQVTLTHSGGYVIYYEGPRARINVRLVPASAGAAIASFRPYGSPGTTLTYNIGSHHGSATFTVQVRHPGTFSVQAVGAPSGSDLAFGPSLAGGIVRGVVGGVLLIVLGLVLAVVLFVVRIVRRRRFS